MIATDISELGKYGFRAEDENFHPRRGDAPQRSESTLYSWVGTDNAGGNLQIVRTPDPSRTTIVFLLHLSGQCLRAEFSPDDDAAFDLDFSDLQPRQDLRFITRINKKLHNGEFHLLGGTQILTGARCGETATIAIDLYWTATGPLCDIPAPTAGGHFAQPLKISAAIRLEQRDIVNFTGYGVRERHWSAQPPDAEAALLELHSRTLQLRASYADGDASGYLCQNRKLQKLRQVAIGEADISAAAAVLRSLSPGAAPMPLTLTDEQGRSVALELERPQCDGVLGESDRPGRRDPSEDRFYRRIALQARGAGETLNGWLEYPPKT